MKNSLLALSLALMLIGCSSKNNLQNKKEITSTIDSIVTNWHNAAANANFDAYFGTMDNHSIFIGTDASENWSKSQFEEFSKPYFDKGKAWSFKAIDRNIYVSKDQKMVWFDELLDTWMGTCRGSGVLERNRDTWKIKHYVLSVAVPNESIEKVMVVKKKQDSIFRKNFVSPKK
jgi:hypothetical protein